MYHCKGSRELSGEEQSYLAENLRCIVLEVGSIENEGERWDYILNNKRNFSEKDFRILKEKGLTLLLTPPQAKRIEQNHDIFQIPVVVVYQRHTTNILAQT